MIRASAAGARLDTNLLSGGGSDDTPALQAILDEARDGTVVHLLIDGPALVTGLEVYSGTTIEFAPGAGLYLAEDSYRALIRNAHPSRDIVVDERITIRGGFFNGNRSGQAHLVFDGWSTRAGWGAPNRDREGTFIAGLQFFGVRELTLENLTVWNPRSFGIWVANAAHVVMRDITIDSNYPPVPENVPPAEIRAYLDGFRSNLDGIHINGPAQYLVLERLRLRTEDDAIGMNANDMAVDDMTVDDAMGPYVGQGPITDVVVRDVVLVDALLGIRLLSSDQRFDRITIENLSGTVRARMTILSHFGSPSRGNFGTISYRNVAVDPRPFPTMREMYPERYTGPEADLLEWSRRWDLDEEGLNPLFSLNSSIERLSLLDVSVHVIDARPVVRVGPDSNIGVLAVGLDVRDARDDTTPLRLEWGSHIAQLHLAMTTTRIHLKETP